MTPDQRGQEKVWPEGRAKSHSFNFLGENLFYPLKDNLAGFVFGANVELLSKIILVFLHMKETHDILNFFYI